MVSLVKRQALAFCLDYDLMGPGMNALGRDSA